MRRYILKIFGILTFVGFALSLTPSVAQQAIVGKHDTDQPIDIEADSLEVQQENNLAIFRGNVDVKQGNIRLQSQELRVTYGQAGDNDGGASSGGVSGAIRQIEAKGNVFMSTPNETAKGDRGSYDVVNKQIKMSGNVVLTRGKNILRGEQLVYNMVNGHSELKGGKKKRVSGRFETEKKKK